MQKEIINKWQIESSLLHFISNILLHYNPKNIIEIGDFAEQVLNYCLFTNDKKFLKTPTANNLLERNRFYEEFDALPNRSAIVEIMPLENQTFKIDSDLISSTLKSLENDGILCLLVPSKFLTFPEYSDFRKLIIDNYSIDIVIDFATISKVTSVRTTLLVVRNGVKNDLIYFGRVESSKKYEEQLKNIQTKTGDFWIESSKLVNRIDRSFHNPEYDSIKKYLSENETKTIGQLAEVISGKYIKKENISLSSGLPIIGLKNIIDDEIRITNDTKYLIEQSILDENFITREGDILISLVVKPGVIYTVKKSDPKCIIGQSFAIVRSLSQTSEYIKTYLSFKNGQDIFGLQANMKLVGSAVPRLTIHYLKQIQIPIIPLKNLNLDSVSDRNISSSNTAELQFIKKEIESTISNVNVDSLLYEYIKNRFDKIDAKLFELGEKVDTVIQTLNLLTENIQKVKNLPREDEEKLIKINRLIDDKLSELNFKKDRNGYIDDVKNWFQYWDFLDEASKEFLPSAEYLFDEISNIGSEDYSPFIIQYCRAIENELLKKLFETFHLEIKTIYSEEELKKLLTNEIEIADNKAKEFAKSISKNDSKYTLGQMNYILGLTRNGGSTLKTSILIQHFRTFILAYYNEMVIEKVYLAKINTITNDFRNKSAHPYILTLDIAKECQVIIRDGLNYFFENKLLK
jgi:hypothetical protein